MGARTHKAAGVWAVLALLLSAALLSACGGSNGDEGSLTVYSGRSETLVGPLIQRFKDDSGIDVSVKYAGTPQLAATLLEEGGKTPADIFFAQDPGGLSAVSELLEPLADASLDLVPEWAVSPTGVWVGVSGRARTVVYNTERLTPEDLPEDLTGFADPKWQGRIGWAPTNASFQTMVTAMRAMWGEAKTVQWLKDIQANDPKVYPKNTPIVSAAAAGEIDVGLVNHYYLHRFLAEEGDSFGARNYHPAAGGPGGIVMVSGVGILSASENENNAQRFVDFLLSEESQRYFADETFEYPLAAGIPVVDGVAPLSEINNPDLSSADLADLEGTQKLLREAGVIP
ncbi:MAG: iron ABC transporter substrate-binding protein [SAR202 cluster bacterium Io17-Chloro-G6]|nr:MAG: iron ABC transporter substrate-binding protein [SAR202 cluster bacterium Io17-Chloro-G6]